MSWTRRLIAVLFGIALITSLMYVGSPSLASPMSNNDAIPPMEVNAGHGAQVTIVLEDLGLDFGTIENWEASLYAGAEIGEETSGRFTEWKAAVDGQVVFLLPDEVREGDEAPWNVPNDTYVRIRETGEDAYPTFDMVSDPFTLDHGHMFVRFGIDGTIETASMVPPPTEQLAEVTVMLQDWGGDFGAPGLWEASLYAGAVPGEETSGRFTEWVEVQDGMVVFALPNDVREGDEAPWDAEAYVRVRTVDENGTYPQFDLVGRPFILTGGLEITSTLHIHRRVLAADAIVTVTLHDMGLEFGAIENWEASLYAGAEVGEETSGRFTEWKPAVNGQVVFLLPGEVREGDEAPWDVANDTYVRIRTTGEETYPTFDLVSDAFTLTEGHHVVPFVIDSINEIGDNDLMSVDQATQITVMLQDRGGEFGAPGLWEASLYAGAVPGEETSGRFTEWVVVENETVVFTLPDDVREGDEAPWGDDVYVRMRTVDENDSYPEFDLVGRPFTLMQGVDVTSTIILQRGMVDWMEIYLPLMMNDAMLIGGSE